MAWSEIGNFSTADKVAAKLNELGIGSSATISLNAARDSFVLWADTDNNPNPTKRWKALASDHNQDKIAEIMNDNGLAPNCAIVSVDANKKWQLWGFVDS